MIVGRYELERFVDISKIKTDVLLEKLNSIGLEVDGFKKTSIPSGVRIGFVEECEKHPNAEKLSVCRVNIGEQEPLVIVCGAKNVQKGQFVPVATIGTILKNGLEIKKSKLRGVESHGMICSSEELGLPRINEGILVLDDSIGELKVGATLSGNRVLDDDFIEIGITPNRGDCLSVYGICRDISAAFGVKLKEIEYKEKNDNVLGIGRTLQVTHKHKLNASLYYRMIEVKEVKTPLVVAVSLSNNGILKNSDMDNLCEYATHICGVVINSYHSSELDYEDSEHKKYLLEIKKDNNSLEAVYGKKRLAYIGYDRERPQESHDKGEFIIEASYVDPKNISKLVSEAGLKKSPKTFYRTSRGTNPDLSKGIDFFMSMIDTYTTTIVYSGIHEFLEHKEERTVTVSARKISSILGVDMRISDINEILKSLFFIVDTTVDSDTIVAKIPGFRSDISNMQDIAEEILRIKGIDSIPSSPMHFLEADRMSEGYLEYKKRDLYRNRASISGFSESLHYVFTSKELEESFGFTLKEDKLLLSNPITAEFSELRSSLVPNMVESVSRNINNSQKRVALYEIGSVFDKNRVETQKIAFVFSGLERVESFMEGQQKEIDFFSFAKLVSSSIKGMELVPLSLEIPYMHPFMSADVILQGKKIGYMGALHPTLESKFDIPRTFIAELSFDLLPYDTVKASAFSNLQPLSRDLNFVKDRSVSFKTIKDIVESLGIKTIQKIYPIDVYRGKELKEKESLTIRFIIQPIDSALEESEINDITTAIVEKLKEELGLELR